MSISIEGNCSNPPVLDVKKISDGNAGVQRPRSPGRRTAIEVSIRIALRRLRCNALLGVVAGKAGDAILSLLLKHLKATRTFAKLCKLCEPFVGG